MGISVTLLQELQYSTDITSTHSWRVCCNHRSCVMDCRGGEKLAGFWWVPPVSPLKFTITNMICS